MNKNNLGIDYCHITDKNNDFKNLYDKILLNKKSVCIFTDSMCEKLISDIEEFILGLA